MKFSIREMMLVTVIVAMGAAWLSEHRLLCAAVVDLAIAKEQMEAAEVRIRFLEDRSVRISKQMKKWGLGIYVACGGDPTICKRQADGTFSAVPDSNNDSP